MKNCIVLISIVLICFSCSKPEPIVPAGNQPLYYVKGTIIGNDSINLMAGTNNIYMFPQCIKGEFASPDSIYRYSATLSQAGCISCPPNFTITFTDSNITGPNQPSFASSFLKARNYPFLNQVTQKAAVSVIYTNVSGKVYSSARLNFQPSPASFAILNMEEGPVVNEIKTKKILVRFSCRCYYTGSDYLDFKDVRAGMLLGYK